MNILRPITIIFSFTLLCSCLTTQIVNFDDHLDFDDNFRPIKKKAFPGVKVANTTQASSFLREIYKRKKLDVRLDNSAIEFEEIINAQTVNYPIGTIVYKVGDLYKKLFTNSQDSNFLLTIKETKMSMRGVSLSNADLSGTYLLIATLSNGDKTEVIRIKHDYRVHSLVISFGLKRCIEDAIDELYSVVKVNIDVWDKN